MRGPCPRSNSNCDPEFSNAAALSSGPLPGSKLDSDCAKGFAPGRTAGMHWAANCGGTLQLAKGFAPGRTAGMHWAANCGGTLQLLERKKSGVPDETRNTLESCQPPSTLSTAPPRFRNRLLLPTGSS